MTDMNDSSTVTGAVPAVVASGGGGGGGGGGGDSTAAAAAAAAALDVLSRAAAAAAAVAASSSSSSTSAVGSSATPVSGFFSPSQLLQLLAAGDASAGPTTNFSDAGQRNNETSWLEQLLSSSGGASQLLASISAQMTKDCLRQRSVGTKSLMSACPGNKLFCLMCGQTSRDLAEYEQHLLSHFSLLDPGANNQKNLHYGMRLLQMQNLFNGGNAGPDQTVIATANDLPAVVSKNVIATNDQIATTTATNTVLPPPVMNTKKRKTRYNDTDPADQIIAMPETGTSGTPAASPAIPPAVVATAAFPCTSCHKTFATEVDLKAHMMRHLTQHPFICIFCGKGFKYEHSLNFHVKSYHSAGSKTPAATGESPAATSSTESSHKSHKMAKDLAKCNATSVSDGTTGDHHGTSPVGSPLRLKRKFTITLEEKQKCKLPPPPITVSGSEGPDSSCVMKSPLAAAAGASNVGSAERFMAPTLITDENHNQTTARSFNWSGSNLAYLYGKMPDSHIQIRNEKILVSILEGVNVATGQTMLFYKCCLCSVAFPGLDQMNQHVQNVHNLATVTAAAEMVTKPPSVKKSSDQSSPQPVTANIESHPKHQAAAMAAMTALFAKSDSILDPVVSGASGETNKLQHANTATAVSSGSSTYQCDKCLARFSESFEYAIHSQLHRTLEMAMNTGGSGSGGSGNQAGHQSQPQPPPSSQSSTSDQLQLLNSLMMAGDHHPEKSPAKMEPTDVPNVVQDNSQQQQQQATGVVDFRHILANASKNTDFGRKFAAHLMDGSGAKAAAAAAVAAAAVAAAAASTRSGDDGPKEKPASVPPATSSNTIDNSNNNGDNGNDDDGNGEDDGRPPCLSPPRIKLEDNEDDGNTNSLVYLSRFQVSPVLMTHNNHCEQQEPKSSVQTSVTSESKANHHPSAVTEALNLSGGTKKLTTSLSSPRKSSKRSRTKPAAATAAAAVPGSSSASSSSSSSPSTTSSSSRATGSTTSGERGSASSSLVSSRRNLKEPVDIFDGAGQSLPIQKFPLGDIEETSPGKYKCRFCTKTFDRIFSVHRHERVHTGFKPVMCKHCGRGFSERRNLRHHIIRFHSDGSGRELLKRKRKPKNSATGSAGLAIGKQSHQQQQRQQIPSNFMSSLLSSAAGSLLVNALQFGSGGETTAAASPPPASATGGGGGSFSNLKISLAEINRGLTAAAAVVAASGSGSRTSRNSSEALNLSSLTASDGGGSSRRRKSKPSRKVVAHEKVVDEDNEDDDVLDADEFDDEEEDDEGGDEELDDEEDEDEDDQEEEEEESAGTVMANPVVVMVDLDDEDKTEEEVEEVAPNDQEDSDATTEEPPDEPRPLTQLPTANRSRKKSSKLIPARSNKSKASKNRRSSGRRTSATGNNNSHFHGRGRRSSNV